MQHQQTAAGPFVWRGSHLPLVRSQRLLLFNSLTKPKFQVKSLAIDPSQAHFVSITVNIADVNDWIPNFETPTYQFSVQEDTIPGTIVGQVTAFDQDRDVSSPII